MDRDRAAPPWLTSLGWVALALALVGAGTGWTSYASWAAEWSRPKPKVNRCFLGSKLGLRQPEMESGSEPHDAGDGRTVYLTKAADRAVRCAQILGPSHAQRLAAAFAEPDPDARAKALLQIVEDLPRDASGDLSAVAIGMLVEAALDGLPESDVVRAAEKRRVEIVACRFGASGCQSAPPIPTLAWAGGAVAALGLCGVVAQLARAAVARVRARRGKKPPPSPVAGSALGLGVLSTALASLVLACAPDAAPRDPHSTRPRAATPPAPAPEAPPVAPEPSAAPAVTAEPAAPAGSAAAPPAAPRDELPPKEARPSPACPADMILVEGEYCSEVEHHCKKSWFDESNKKEVCEEFEPRATCTGSRSKKRFCVDRFSWPNVRGERPEVMNNFYQAQVKCAAVGKRLCTESEWTMSCEGPKMMPFPYGWRRDPTKCNGDHPWDEPRMKAVGKRDPKELARLWRGVRNGAQPDCVSEYGVPDLPGNTDDVVASETFSSGWRGKYDSVTTGGPWYKGTRNQCRPKIYTHDEGFYYYYLGFRCCAEPDGVATDPRTPKQRKDGWKMARVESLARFTAEEMRDKLRQKREGSCSCRDGDILCKTMCGTLLGPDAKDADLNAPRVR